MLSHLQQRIQQQQHQFSVSTSPLIRSQLTCILSNTHLFHLSDLVIAAEMSYSGKNPLEIVVNMATEESCHWLRLLCLAMSIRTTHVHTVTCRIDIDSVNHEALSSFLDAVQDGPGTIQKTVIEFCGPIKDTSSTIDVIRNVISRQKLSKQLTIVANVDTTYFQNGELVNGTITCIPILERLDLLINGAGGSSFLETIFRVFQWPCGMKSLHLPSCLDSKTLCESIAASTTLCSLGIVFDASWHTEASTSLQHAFVENVSISKVVVDTTSEAHCEEDVGHGLSFFKCLGHLRRLDTLVLDIDFSKIENQWSALSFVSFCEQLRNDKRKLRSLIIRDHSTVVDTVMDSYDSDLTENLLDVVCSYSNEIISHNIVFDIHNPTLLHAMCSTLKEKCEGNAFEMDLLEVEQVSGGRFEFRAHLRNSNKLHKITIIYRVANAINSVESLLRDDAEVENALCPLMDMCNMGEHYLLYPQLYGLFVSRRVVISSATLEEIRARHTYSTVPQGTLSSPSRQYVTSGGRQTVPSSPGRVYAWN